MNYLFCIAVVMVFVVFICCLLTSTNIGSRMSQCDTQESAAECQMLAKSLAHPLSFVSRAFHSLCLTNQQASKQAGRQAGKQASKRASERASEQPSKQTTQHNTTQHYTTLHYTTLHHTTPHYTTLHYSTQHNTTQHNTTQHNTTQSKH